ncbi:MAG: hypothetical protein FJ096_18245, partial [Deltaproteobacteria bacterium]|nr:hypothetical protein [Deltaproteobacteria bacterium]
KGRSLAKIGVSPEMHLLGTENGLPKLCHYRSDAWTSRRTVYQVVVKARLWFEAFEFHRQTGKPLDYWLGHV